MIGFLYTLFIIILDFCILYRVLEHFSIGRRCPRGLNVSVLLLCAIVLKLVNLYKIPEINLAAVCILIYLYSLTFRFPLIYHITHQYYILV